MNGVDRARFPADAALGIVEGLLWALRGAGLSVSPAQAIVAAEAVSAVGFSSPSDVREAVACVVAHTREERARFDEAFDAFFARARGAGRAPVAAGDLWVRLASRGFAEDELEVMRAWLELTAPHEGHSAGDFTALVEGGATLEHLFHLAGFQRAVAGLQAEMQLGAFQHRALEAVGVPAAYDALRALRSALVRALGPRGEALADALKDELARAGDAVRARVRAMLARRRRGATPSADRPRDLSAVPFLSLSPSDAAEVRAALRRFAAHLEGASAARLRRAARGAIDPHRTLRRAMKTGGVPFELLRRRRKPERPRLILLCDVSDSVRGATAFLLELVQAAHRLFAQTRSFVFVSELGETTELFARLGSSDAIAEAVRAVPVHANSNYGRVFRAFERGYLETVDHRTTVVVLGDGRTNYHEAGVEVLSCLRRRGRALFWFSTERRDGWALGDSAMLRYAPQCTAVLEVTCARELEEATRTIAWR